MDEKLKELTEVIVKEGVDKANEQANKIVAQAKQEADTIVRQARQQADEAIAQAQRRAAELRQNAEAELQLAGRQMMSVLKQRVTDLVLANILDKPISANFGKADFVGQLIVELAKNWKPANTDRLDLRVLLPETMYRDVEQYLQQRAKEVLAAGLKIEMAKQLRSGFQIAPTDGSFKLTFSEAEFTAFFKTFLRAKTNQLLFGDK
jgi:V/A-type H+/Na+-transporting ATPase subunit E